MIASYENTVSGAQTPPSARLRAASDHPPCPCAWFDQIFSFKLVLTAEEYIPPCLSGGALDQALGGAGSAWCAGGWGC